MLLLSRLVAGDPAPCESWARSPKKKTCIAKVLGKYSAKEVAAQRKKTKKIAQPELYPGLEGLQKSDHVRGEKLSLAELARFEEALKACSTSKSDKSRLTTIARILRQEFPKATRGLADLQVLKELRSEEGMKRVAAGLVAEGITSGAGYLSTWANHDKIGELPEELNKKRKKLGRVVSKFGGEPTQAVEMKIENITEHVRLWRWQPTTPGGPCCALVVVLIATLLMLRGLALRSLRRAQVVETGTAVHIKLGKRKANQSGHRSPKTLPLECICKVAPKRCLACWIKKYLRLRDGLIKSEFMFTNEKGKPIAKHAFRKAMKWVGSQIGTPGTSPHSCRLSGARAWAAIGLSESTIMALGDWRNVAVLRRYIGAAGITSRIMGELALAKAPPQAEQHMRPTEMPPEIAAALTLLVRDPANDMAIVQSRRRPFTWHKCWATGPSNRWRTACGHCFNPNTMHVQKWGEKDSEAQLCTSPGCA